MIAWCDTETTGLDPNIDLILEVGIIITDDDLNEVAGTSVLVPWSPDLLARSMRAAPEVVQEMHRKNGLLDELKAAWRADVPAVRMAENELLGWMNRVSAGALWPMAGNSITHDRIFLRRYMPSLLEAFHYRSIDVSGIREAARRFWPELTASEPVKSESSKHRVTGDIRDSIRLLQFYQMSLGVRADAPF